MDWFPLYIDSEQLSIILPEYGKKCDFNNRDIDAMLRDSESKGEIRVFKDMDSAIDFVDSGEEAILHIDTSFLMMDFILPNTDPAKVIDKAKAIRFEYNTLDIYDYADNYFKKRKIRIPMCLPLEHVCPGKVDSFRPLASVFTILWKKSLQENQQTKLIRLDVFGRLAKRYSFYKIDPIYVRIEN